MGIRVMVTGAAGLYGIHCCRELAASPKFEKVIALDNFSRNFVHRPELLFDGMNRKVQLMKKDFGSLKAKDIDAMNIDAIVHYAAFVSIDESMVSPSKYFKNNEEKTFNFSNELLKTKTQPRLIYASSPEVYGNPQYTPMDELHPMNPRSFYAASKLASEKHAMVLWEWYGYNVNAIRNFNTFGENQNLSAYSAAIPAFIGKALKNENLNVTGKGGQTRDFMYVKDAVRAYRLLLEKPSIKGEAFNIGTGKQTKIKDIANKIVKLSGSKSKVKFVKERKGDLTALEADISKIKKTLGWKPKYGLDEGLQRTIDWYKQYVK